MSTIVEKALNLYDPNKDHSYEDLGIDRYCRIHQGPYFYCNFFDPICNTTSTSERTTLVVPQIEGIYLKKAKGHTTSYLFSCSNPGPSGRIVLLLP